MYEWNNFVELNLNFPVTTEVLQNERLNSKW